MKNKGIAIRTILLLVVGILVVGIIVYFAYRYLTQSPALTEADCRARIISYCTGCYNGRAADGSFQGGPQMQQLVRDCQLYGVGGCAVTTNCAGDCGDVTVQDLCRGYIPMD